MAHNMMLMPEGFNFVIGYLSKDLIADEKLSL